jgi:hypothetical protein
MSIADLQSIAEGAKHHDPGNLQRFMIQQKFSIPAASIVLALIGLASASATAGRAAGELRARLRVIFTYYVVLWTSRAAAITGRFPASLAPWMPNVLFGAAGVALLLWRSRSADQPIRLSVPAFWSRRSANPAPSTPSAPSTPTSPRPGPRRRVVVVVRIPHFDWPRPTLLDMRVQPVRQDLFPRGGVAARRVLHLHVHGSGGQAVPRLGHERDAAAVFTASDSAVCVCHIIPMSVLVATLVTIGLMTKNSELVVMRACGISLPQRALALLIFGLGASAVLFGLQEQVIAFSNREADRLNRMDSGLPPASGALDRRWLSARTATCAYDLFDSKNEFSQFTVHRIERDAVGLASMLHADRVVLARQWAPTGRVTTTWTGAQGLVPHVYHDHPQQRDADGGRLRSV